MSTQPELVDCEIFLAMNEDGGWIVTKDESDAMSELAEYEGGYHCRVVKATIRMRPPFMHDAGSLVVPDDAGTTTAFATS